jgi:hypothetical protein
MSVDEKAFPNLRQFLKSQKAQKIHREIMYRKFYDRTLKSIRETGTIVAEVFEEFLKVIEEELDGVKFPSLVEQPEVRLYGDSEGFVVLENPIERTVANSVVVWRLKNPVTFMGVDLQFQSFAYLIAVDLFVDETGNPDHFRVQIRDKSKDTTDANKDSLIKVIDELAVDSLNIPE